MCKIIHFERYTAIFRNCDVSNFFSMFESCSNSSQNLIAVGISESWDLSVWQSAKKGIFRIWRCRQIGRSALKWEIEVINRFFRSDYPLFEIPTKLNEKFQNIQFDFLYHDADPSDFQNHFSLNFEPLRHAKTTIVTRKVRRITFWEVIF